jgi:hypothetical protein
MNIQIDFWRNCQTLTSKKENQEMRNLNLSNIAAPVNEASGAEDKSGIKRRQFLQTIGVAGIALALSPENLFAQSAGEAKEWRDLVTNFIFTVADDGQARVITSQLNRASIYYQSRDGSPFHDFYSAPHIFVGSTIDSQRVICGNGFQVVQLPYYDVGHPCRSVNDLNASEIFRVIDPDEIKRFGCVLTPDGSRTPLDYNDHAKYLGKAASDYGMNINEWEVPYKRRLTGVGRAHTGYHFIHKTQRTVHGRPRTDFIVSSDI